MMKSYLLPTMILLLLGLTGCDKDGIEDYEAPEDQPVLFEYRYVNLAWGYFENGWLIDSKGNINSYNLPVEFNIPDSNGYISREDLLHNLNQTDSITFTFGTKDLDYYTGLISGAAKGKVGEAESIAADAGSSVLSCYLYDADKDMYQYIFLASSGDWQQFNQSGEAKILINWMKGLDIFWLSH